MKMYDRNIYCNYITFHIMRNTSSCIKKCLLSLYKKLYDEKYTFMYDRNVCCHYISSYIMKNKYCHYTSSCIITIHFHESQKYLYTLLLKINKQVFSLYIVLYYINLLLIKKLYSQERKSQMLKISSYSFFYKNKSSYNNIIIFTRRKNYISHL